MKLHAAQKFLLVTLLLIFNACEKPGDEVIEGSRGDLVSGQIIAGYNSDQIALILESTGAADLSAKTSQIRAVKLKYLSPNADGELQTLSGALIFPVDTESHGLMSIGHGTVTKYTKVASTDPSASSAGLSALVTASQGYVTIVPDYAGYGDSRVLHPYLHAESLSSCIIDMIRATQIYCEENDIGLSEKLFLTGYSEGGYATLAAQRTLELELADEFQVTASAPMAGPYDLHSTAEHILKQDSYTWPAYIGFLFVAYDHIYDLNGLSDVFTGPYAANVQSFYDGTSTFNEINNQLPQQLSELISQDFIDSYLDSSETRYSNAFKDNGLLDWAPVAPTRLYHGMLDRTVPYEIAELTANQLQANGAVDLQLVGIPGATHETAGLPAVFLMLEWFGEF